MEKIRKYIKEVLQKILSEAEQTGHYLDRVKGRLKSHYTYPKFDFNSIEPLLNILQETNFPKNTSYGIRLKVYPPKEETTYEFLDPRTDKMSKGNEVWAIVRENQITSIFFRFSGQGKFKENPVDVYLNGDQLEKNYEIQKSKNKISKDGKVFYSPEDSKEKELNKYQLDLPTIQLRGKNWYIDQKNEKLINVKNIKSQIDIYNELNPQEQEMVFMAV